MTRIKTFMDDWDELDGAGSIAESDAVVLILELDVIPLLPHDCEEARTEISALEEDIDGSYAGVAHDFIEVLREVEDLLRHGDAEEAERRLRLLTAPKFTSIKECQKAYSVAMREKRSAEKTYRAPQNPVPWAELPMFQ